MKPLLFDSLYINLCSSYILSGHNLPLWEHQVSSGATTSVCPLHQVCPLSAGCLWGRSSCRWTPRSMPVSSLASPAVPPSPPVLDYHGNHSPLFASLPSGVAIQVKVYFGMLNSVTLWDSGRNFKLWHLKDSYHSEHCFKIQSAKRPLAVFIETRDWPNQCKYIWLIFVFGIEYYLVLPVGSAMISAVRSKAAQNEHQSATRSQDGNQRVWNRLLANISFLPRKGVFENIQTSWESHSIVVCL